MSDRVILLEAEAQSESEDDAQTEEKEEKVKKKKHKKAQLGFERKLKGAKNLVMLPFKKFDKVVTRKKRRPPPPPPFPYSEDSVNGCHLCFARRKMPSDDSVGGNKDDKISSYDDFLRSFLEKNDFYCPECNVHCDLI